MDGQDYLGEPVKFLASGILLLLILAAGAAAQEGEVVPPPSRDVTPPGVTPAPGGDGPLLREPVPPPPPEAARWRRYHLPVTTDSATFLADGITIRISGVEPPPIMKICKEDDGETWPCGRTALFSFRGFLRGRGVECYFPPPGTARQVIAPCRVGGTDLALWLLSQGWAMPAEYATDEYRKAATDAHCRRLGVWRGMTPDKSCPPLPKPEPVPDVATDQSPLD
jgi:endonuclease YncB( thermonuclease family)